MWKFVGVVFAAVLLGMVSPFMVAADDGPLLRAWLQWLPVQVDQLFLPSGDVAMLALAMLVLTAQYLLIFILVIPLRQLVRGFLKFNRTPLRRGYYSN